MSVLVFADNSEGIFKKTACEVVSYGKQVAKQSNTNLVVLTINAEDVSLLSSYGADKIIKINDGKLSAFSAKGYASCIQQVADSENANIIIVDSSNDGLYLAPLLAVKLKAGYAANTVSLPVSLDPFSVKRKAFSSKGFNFSQLNTERKLIGLAKNSFGLVEESVESDVSNFSPQFIDSDFSIKSVSIEKTTGKVTIADADIVVSGGRA